MGGEGGREVRRGEKREVSGGRRGKGDESGRWGEGGKRGEKGGERGRGVPRSLVKYTRK